MKASILLLLMMALGSCGTDPVRASFSTTPLIPRASTFLVLSQDNGPLDIVFADHLRKYLAVNGPWKIPNSEFSENLAFGQAYAHTNRDTLPGEYPSEILRLDLKNLPSAPGCDIVLVCHSEPQSIVRTKTELKNVDGSSGGSTSQSVINVLFEVRIMRMKDGNVIHQIANTNSTMFHTFSGWYLFTMGNAKGMLACIDEFSRNYVTGLVETMRGKI